MICISFDTDRISDDRMREFLARVEIPGTATFFCTQLYDSLNESRYELGPHVYLPAGADWEEELRRKRADFPAAIGWRSHSCVFSHLLAEQLAQTGYEYVSVHDEMGRAGLQPVRHAWGLWHLPIFYMDNLDFSTSRFWRESEEPFSQSYIETALSREGLYVFAFHPVHLMLNSPSAEEYFRRRDPFADGAAVEEVTYPGYGTLDFYDDLCAAMRDEGVESSSMRDALAAFLAADVPS